MYMEYTVRVATFDTNCEMLQYKYSKWSVNPVRSAMELVIQIHTNWVYHNTWLPVDDDG